MDYEFLAADTISDYIASRSELEGVVDPSAIASVEEVGDGNLNLVFIVTDTAGNSVVLKQALPYVRLVGPDWPMTPTRAEKEANALEVHGKLCPDLVPKTFFFDADRYVIGMENLSDYRVWRGALMEGERHEGVAAQMGEYVARVAFGTSALSVDAEELKGRIARAVNPELCKITEDLVFTEPHDDIGRNSVLPANEKDAAEHASDASMIAAMGEAKWIFMTRAEALIHGDLHTGSVMVKHGADDGVARSKAFDSEFAFYGPIAFDLGALFANYCLSAARFVALGNEELVRWNLALVEQTWGAFEETFRSLYPDRADARVWGAELEDSLVATWWEQSILFSTAKMSRRIVGLAKVADIETLDEDLREGAARGVLHLARSLARDRSSLEGPDQYIARAHSVLAEFVGR